VRIEIAGTSPAMTPCFAGVRACVHKLEQILILAQSSYTSIGTPRLAVRFEVV
jgi:hypothetical protein